MTLSIVIRCIFTGFLMAIPAPIIVNWLQGPVGLNLGVIIYLAAAASTILGCLILSATPAITPKKSTVASKAKTPGIKGSSQADGRETGVVKWFNVSKGFGFITRSSGEDVFVHYRSIRSGGRRTLSDGQSVEFIVTEGEKGLQAEDVSAVS